MQKAIILSLVFMSVGCGTSTTYSGPCPTATGTPTVTASPLPVVVESAVQTMVDTENQYRESVGQELLLPGLACTVYNVSQSTSCITNNGTISCTPFTALSYSGFGSFLFSGTFNQPVAPTTAGLNVLPTAMQGVVQNWYVIKCTGDLVVSDDGYHEFDLTSDDGSNLYVDGLLIYNDGLHSTATKSATKYLKYGFHSFELDYFQGAGQESLILNKDGAPMQSNGTEAWYH